MEAGLRELDGGVVGPEAVEPVGEVGAGPALPLRPRGAAGRARRGALPGHMIDYCRVALGHVSAGRLFSVYGWS